MNCNHISSVDFKYTLLTHYTQILVRIGYFDFYHVGRPVTATAGLHNSDDYLRVNPGLMIMTVTNSANYHFTITLLLSHVAPHYVTTHDINNY